jgi:hypothetical protein
VAIDLIKDIRDAGVILLRMSCFRSIVLENVRGSYIKLSAYKALGPSGASMREDDM